VTSRLVRWYDESPVTGDACLAALLLLAFVLPSDLSTAGTAGADLAFSVALLAAVPFRRRAPVKVFIAVSVLCLVQLAVLDHAVAGDVVPLIAVYTVVAYGPGGRLSAVATACALVGAGLAAARWDEPGDSVSLVQVAGSTVGSVALAATLGAWRRSRRAELAALALERDQQAAVGAAIERARIARELHDVVAHSLSVIVVQADGAAAGAEQRPAAAAAALRTIGDTGREALGQMRHLLDVLREGGDDADLAPQPGAGELEGLVGQVARAGLPAQLSVDGVPRPLAGTVDLTVYRVAQEALTNVLKHGEAVTRVDVVLRYRDDAVELVVRDDGRAAPTTSHGRGYGLIGMRERVHLHHGTLSAGPPAGGGFEIHAVIPT
jgi:signal transduction histidine kinase